MGDNADLDDDNDGVSDSADLFPLDSSEPDAHDSDEISDVNELAENGEQAVNALAEGFDLVILDLMMPIMDGFEFLAHLKDMTQIKQPEVIVYSAVELDEAMKATLRDQCSSIIDKKLAGSMSDLEKVLRKLK